MVKKVNNHKKPSKAPRPSGWRISRRARLVVVPVMAIVATGVVVLTVLAIVVMPLANQGTQRGVGANGFRAFTEEGTSLGIDKVVSKEEVVSGLDDKAVSVDDVEVSEVFNLNGDRRQTATYTFVRADGATASFYVDVLMFKNFTAMNNAHILAATENAGEINGYPAYYMHAQTLGKDREYSLLVVNGLKAYKFVITQPHRDITISEVAALASLRRIATEAEL